MTQILPRVSVEVMYNLIFVCLEKHESVIQVSKWHESKLAMDGLYPKDIDFQTSTSSIINRKNSLDSCYLYLMKKDKMGKKQEAKECWTQFQKNQLILLQYEDTTRPQVIG